LVRPWSSAQAPLARTSWSDEDDHDRHHREGVRNSWPGLAI
jgi:hypothetical protein